MRRLYLTTLLVPAALAGLPVLCTPSAFAQQVLHVDSEPTGLKALDSHVSGRVEALPGGAVRRQWPGTYVESAFLGTEAYFRVGPGEVSLRVKVDGAAPTALVKPVPGLYRVAAPASPGPHRVRVDIASESQAGATVFGGFFLAPGASPSAFAARRHQIEFIGDSHTVGYGNTSTTPECTGEQVWETTDTSVGVAPELAARYDADYEVNAISGRGVVRNFNGFAADALPVVYPFALFDKASRANEPDWRPQAMVISLGTNDFSMPLHEGERWTRREQLQSDFEAAYSRFVLDLHQRHPRAYVLLWAATSEDSELAAEVRKVVHQVRQSSDARIDFVAVAGLALTGCHYHPSVADDQRIATSLARHLEARVPELRASFDPAKRPD